MSRRLPPLNPLRAFEATARHRSLTKAARELSVTHGAVSHQIKALETSLSVRLFDRIGQRLILTEHGAELLPSVSSAFEEIAAATARLTRPAKSGTLSIACVPALLSFWLLPRLASFTARYPEIRLTLEAANDPDLIHSPDVDIAILYGDGSWTDCWLKLWSHLDLFPIASPTLVNNRPIRTPRDLADHTILHGDDGHEWRIWFSAADIPSGAIGRQHHFSDARLSIEAAVLGHGIALGDTVTAANLMSRGQIVIPFNLAVPAVDAFYVACSNDARAAPVVDLFINWLFASLEEEDARAEPQISARRTIRRTQIAPSPQSAPPHTPDKDSQES